MGKYKAEGEMMYVNCVSIEKLNWIDKLVVLEYHREWSLSASYGDPCFLMYLESGNNTLLLAFAMFGLPYAAVLRL